MHQNPSTFFLFLFFFLKTPVEVRTAPMTGRLTDPQVSAAQCTNPLRKSANKAPNTGERLLLSLASLAFLSIVGMKSDILELRDANTIKRAVS